MRVIRDVVNIKNTEPIVCALGNFDGLHYGHKCLLEKARDVAIKQGLKFAIMTFDPHPAIFFKRAKNIRILPIRDKLDRFKELSADIVFIQEFDQKFANLPAEEFLLTVLLKDLNVQHIVIGHDFIFGKNRSGDAEFLRLMSEKHGFGFSQIGPQYSPVHNLIYSSSQIRRAVREGDVKLAKELMGQEFAISGEVIKGNKIGGELGYHTANLDLQDFVQPKFGVYAVKILINGKYHKAVANIGVRPTMTDAKTEMLEIHIFDFKSEIYGELVTVKFIDFVRHEKKFATSEELTNQIANDCSRAQEILAEREEG